MAANLHPEYGYDLDRVPRVKCLMCKKRIGDSPYKEVAILARFGQMLFIHSRCEGKPDRKMRLRTSVAHPSAIINQ